MNLRILKKLSRRAAPLLPRLGDNREQFRAVRGDNYLKTVILDRKHFERGRSANPTLFGEHMTKWPAKDGDGWIYMKPPSHPRKGTIMVGAVSGYYEPEWYEETAWDALREIVYAHFTDWENDARLMRCLDTPALIFAAAKEIIAFPSTGCDRE